MIYVKNTETHGGKSMWNSLAVPATVKYVILKYNNIMHYLKFSIGIFLALAASRFVPHPPNFTSLLALSFYIPVLLGIRFLPALIVSFVITDYFIGFHSFTLFTYASVIIIGLVSKYFAESLLKRIGGALLGAVIFFLLTNFGVWTLGSCGYSLQGLILCFTIAIPFFAYSLISTFIFSGIIEIIFKLEFFNKEILKIVNQKWIYC